MTSEAQFLEQRRSAAMLARLAPLLRRAMHWLVKWSMQGPEAAVPASTVESAAVAADHRGERAVSDDVSRESLPWWVSHHPAVSFRGQQPDERCG